MLDDLIKGVREYISDRFMSPLGAALVTSWCGWNYKFILIALSSEPVIRKLHLIRMVYQDSSWTLLLLGPAVTASIYLFLFPYPSRWVYAFTLSRRRDALDTLREIEKQTPLTKEESQALRDRFTKIETDHLAEKLRLNSALDAVKDQLRVALEGKQSVEEELLKALNPSLPPATLDEADRAEVNAGISGEHSASQVESPLPRFTPAHTRVMREIGRHKDPPSHENISEALNLAPTVTSLILDDLMVREMVEKVRTSRTEAGRFVLGYRPTTTGIRFLLQDGA